MNLSECRSVVEISALAKLGELQSLQQLTLDLGVCKSVVEISALAKLGELQSLQQLTLSLYHCKRVVDVWPLAKLGRLQSLQQLEVDLQWCDELPCILQRTFSSRALLVAACMWSKLSVWCCRCRRRA